MTHYHFNFFQIQLATAEKEWRLLLSKYRQLVTDSIELRLELETCKFELDRITAKSTPKPHVTPKEPAKLAAEHSGSSLEFDAHFVKVS